MTSLSTTLHAVGRHHDTRCMSNRERKCADTLLAQCWFPGLAIFNAKIRIYCGNKILSNSSTRKLSWFEITKMLIAVLTRSSAIAEGPRDASCQLKSCQLPRNSAETTYTPTTSPDRIDGMKLEI